MKRKFMGAVVIGTLITTACANTEKRDIAKYNIETESEITTNNIETEPEIISHIEMETYTEQQSEGGMEESMYYTALTDEIKTRITGKSYPVSEDNIQISYDDLSYLHVLYYDFNDEVQEGEIICNKEIAQDLLEIFQELYDNKYQIEKIRLVDEYDADDEASMADNNTSCFNYRTIAGTDKISNHSYGKAIDINPLYNPYVTTKNSVVNVSPENAVQYVDRTAGFDHKIDTDDLCYKLFIQHGFTWGGAWKNSKDYQHFEKK